MVRAAALLLLACCGSGAQAATRIDYPRAFIAQVYKHLIDSQESGRPYQPPDDIYTQRLKKFFLRDQRWAKGGIGCIDFGFWVNAQDWTISDLHISARAPGPDRRNVVASFRNMGHAEEIQFDFRRVGTRWLIDDVQSLMGVRWTLSKILNCRH